MLAAPETPIERMRASLPPDQLKAALALLSPADLTSIVYDWRQWARQGQLLPAGEWTTWLILAGRGWGKTRTGAEAVRAWHAQGYRYINFIARTAEDLRTVMVEGESGILAVCPPEERPIYQPSKARLVWPNGALTLLFSAEEPDRMRGPQSDKLWCDEPASWQYADDAWDQAQFGLRLGNNPQAVATTTPRPTKLIRTLLAAPHTVTTRGTSYDNRANLSEIFYSAILKKYENTRLGRQEISGEVLTDNPGALWRLADIDAARIRERREYRRIVVAIDPATTSNPDSDETGIIVAGLVEGSPAHFDVLEDASGIYAPDAWAKRAVELYWQWEADRVIGEANNGGDMIEAVLRHQDANVSYSKVTASRGKAIRAEPISALYEQHRVHHVGVLPALEDQLTNWDPATAQKSPDRLDALVWALTELSAQNTGGFAEYYARKARKAGGN